MAKKQTTHTNGGGSRPKRARSPQKPADTRSKRGHGAKSEATRECAVLALLSEKTVADAAKKAKVDEKTLRRWLSEDEAFRAEYAAARQVVFQSGLHRVQALTAKAVDTLEDLLDAEINANVRLGAARTVAEIGIHQHDAETILQKLDKMESDQRRQQGR